MFPDRRAARQPGFPRPRGTYLAVEGDAPVPDIGTGLPTADNTHEVAQRVAPSPGSSTSTTTRGAGHARALLTSTPEGVTEYIDADLPEPTRCCGAHCKLWTSPTRGAPLLGVLRFILDPVAARAYRQAGWSPRVPSGSYLAMSDGTATSERVIESHRQYNESGAI